MNGHNGTNGARNGASSHQNGKDSLNPRKDSAIAVSTSSSDLTPTDGAQNKVLRTEAFDQPVILQQTRLWSHAILWGIMGVATFVVVWASLAKIEEAVPATGQLQPQSQVQPVQAPVGGVVQQIYVKDGQRVKQGDLLIRLDPTAAEAQRRSLEQIKDSLTRQNQFYQSQLSGAAPLTLEQAKQLKIAPEILSLTENRAALISENQLYQTQLSGSSNSASLTPDQRIRLQIATQEANTRASTAQLEVSQLQQQLAQTQSQLSAAQQSLAIDENIYNDLRPLLEDGGISRVQVVKQQQQVIQSRGEVNRLSQEMSRLRYAINQAQQKLQNTVALTNNDLLNKIADNNKKISEIDSQLNRAVLDNQNRISEIDSQLSQTDVTLRYQELRAPIDGVVFDMKAKGPGFVANTNDPVLKIVPGNGLVAEVYVTNQDIGFVREGMPVDVRVDSFPSSEFGDIKGELTQIGSDALPPDQVHPFYRFPAKITIEQQYIPVNGNKVPLQSGMSISANIITRKRTVMSIFLDQFSQKVNSLKTVR